MNALSSRHKNQPGTLSAQRLCHLRLTLSPTALPLTAHSQSIKRLRHLRQEASPFTAHSQPIRLRLSRDLLMTSRYIPSLSGFAIQEICRRNLGTFSALLENSVYDLFIFISIYKFRIYSRQACHRQSRHIISLVFTGSANQRLVIDSLGKFISLVFIGSANQKACHRQSRHIISLVFTGSANRKTCLRQSWQIQYNFFKSCQLRLVYIVSKVLQSYLGNQSPAIIQLGNQSPIIIVRQSKSYKLLVRQSKSYNHIVRQSKSYDHIVRQSNSYNHLVRQSKPDTTRQSILQSSNQSYAIRHSSPKNEDTRSFAFRRRRQTHFDVKHIQVIGPIRWSTRLEESFVEFLVT